jgi:hypothetical protein
MSVSFERTGTRTFTLRLVEAESFTATGGSLVQVIVTEPVEIFERAPEASTAR